MKRGGGNDSIYDDGDMATNSEQRAKTNTTSLSFQVEKKESLWDGTAWTRKPPLVSKTS